MVPGASVVVLSGLTCFVVVRWSRTSLLVASDGVDVGFRWRNGWTMWVIGEGVPFPCRRVNPWVFIGMGWKELEGKCVKHGRKGG